MHHGQDDTLQLTLLQEIPIFIHRLQTMMRMGHGRTCPRASKPNVLQLFAHVKVPSREDFVRCAQLSKHVHLTSTEFHIKRDVHSGAGLSNTVADSQRLAIGNKDRSELHIQADTLSRTAQHHSLQVVQNISMI